MRTQPLSPFFDPAGLIPGYQIVARDAWAGGFGILEGQSGFFGSLAMAAATLPAYPRGVAEQFKPRNALDLVHAFNLCSSGAVLALETGELAESHIMRENLISLITPGNAQMLLAVLKKSENNPLREAVADELEDFGFLLEDEQENPFLVQAALIDGQGFEFLRRLDGVLSPQFLAQIYDATLVAPRLADGPLDAADRKELAEVRAVKSDAIRFARDFLNVLGGAMSGNANNRSGRKAQALMLSLKGEGRQRLDRIFKLLEIEMPDDPDEKKVYEDLWHWLPGLIGGLGWMKALDAKDLTTASALEKQLLGLHKEYIARVAPDKLSQSNAALAVIGNPRSNPTQRLAATAQLTQNTIASAISHHSQDGETEAGEDDPEIAETRFARTTLTAFSNALPGRALSGPEATVTRLLAEPSVSIESLLIYAHGTSGSAQERPAILLGGPNGSLLTSQDILKWGVRARLVLLAACSTGSQGSTGLQPYGGLVSSFLLTGSQSVLTAQRRVDESATSQLIVDLSGRLAKRSSTPAEALRLSMRQLASRSETRNPVLWAQLIWVGDGGR